MSPYRATGPDESAEPDSDGRVLANKMGITEQRELDEAETQLLRMLYEEVFANLEPDQPLDVPLIKHWHRRWLGNLYDWAGQERQVNLQKDGFMFAAASQVPYGFYPVKADSDHFEPMEPEDPNAPPGKSLEQLAEENPDLAGYRQALSGIIAQSLD
ncbi:MAG: hypothetical protein R6U45_07740 [Thioalkalivibrio sp.]|uniref:hypothetical protein n=1 Tax=Thioalkalivibrio sp. TaxID=2093813 RepID=UPI003976997B